MSIHFIFILFKSNDVSFGESVTDTTMTVSCSSWESVYADASFLLRSQSSWLQAAVGPGDDSPWWPLPSLLHPQNQTSRHRLHPVHQQVHTEHNSMQWHISSFSKSFLPVAVHTQVVGKKTQCRRFTSRTCFQVITCVTVAFPVLQESVVLSGVYSLSCHLPHVYTLCISSPPPVFRITMHNIAKRNNTTYQQ